MTIAKQLVEDYKASKMPLEVINEVIISASIGYQTEELPNECRMTTFVYPDGSIIEKSIDTDGSVHLTDSQNTDLTTC